MSQSKIKLTIKKFNTSPNPDPETGIDPSSGSSSASSTTSMSTSMSGTEHDFKSLSKLNEYISQIVENNIFFMFNELLQKISTDYQLSYDQLKDQYLSYFKKNLTNSSLYCQLLSLNATDLSRLTQMINQVPILSYLTGSIPSNVWLEPVVERNVVEENSVTPIIVEVTQQVNHSVVSIKNPSQQCH